MKKRTRRPRGTVAGLRFECVRGCTSCCAIPGVVFVHKSEIPAMAEFFKETEEEFTTKRLIHHWADMYLLDFPEDEPCIFLEEKGCSIYPVRPAQCRTFPFWPENINNPEKWEELKQICPGIGRGKVHSIDLILEIMSEVAYGPFL